MSDVAAPSQPSEINSLRNTAIMVHGLMAAGMLFFGVPTLVGLVIAYMKRKDAAGSIYESHLTYAIRTFWIGLAMSFVGSLLLILFVGLPILIFTGVWFIVRIVRAILAWLDNKAIDNPARFS
jgi:uncharacterized membrane protein